MKFHPLIGAATLGFVGVVAGAAPEHEVPYRYDVAVTVTGTVHALYDMSFVDSDVAPRRDPGGVPVKFPNPKIPQKPVRHWILTLDHRITVAAGEKDGLHVGQTDVAEIDLGPAKPGWKEGGRAVVNGKLRAAHTIHHLRPLMMDVSLVAGKIDPQAHPKAAG